MHGSRWAGVHGSTRRLAAWADRHSPDRRWQPATAGHRAAARRHGLRHGNRPRRAPRRRTLLADLAATSAQPRRGGGPACPGNAVNPARFCGPPSDALRRTRWGDSRPCRHYDYADWLLVVPTSNVLWTRRRVSRFRWVVAEPDPLRRRIPAALVLGGTPNADQLLPPSIDENAIAGSRESDPRRDRATGPN